MVSDELSVGEREMVMRQARWRACECVTLGHPDKVCDQISDEVLDAALSQDPNSRVAIETTGGHGKVTVNGEMTTKAVLDLTEIARFVYREIGHNHSISVTVNVAKQSENINNLVSEDKARNKEQGAGDQGIMIGFATVETPEFMPSPWVLSRELCNRLVKVRTSGILPWLLPDGKSQIVLEGDEIRHITIAAHYQKGCNLDDVRLGIMEHVVKYMFPSVALALGCNVIINGGGEFYIGGFEADSGSTGRKIVVDQYGPDIPVGGGAFSGKDPSKVDRSAAYMCRFVAKSIVASGLARQALVRVVYAIGQSTPCMISLDTDLSDKRAEALLEQKVQKMFDFRPAAIIERFRLLHPNGWNYRETAALGHYGNSKFPWEQAVPI